jgi:hypothetical protein
MSMSHTATSVVPELYSHENLGVDSQGKKLSLPQIASTTFWVYPASCSIGTGVKSVTGIKLTTSMGSCI